MGIAPMLIRVGGVIQAEDMSSNTTAIVVFFDKSNLIINFLTFIKILNIFFNYFFLKDTVKIYNNWLFS